MSETLEAPSANAPELVRVTQLARALSAVCGRAFTLRKVYGYSGKETATRLGIPDEAEERAAHPDCAVCAQESTTDRSGLARAPSPPEEAQVANR
jgi:DNA-directed RNA polymerase specialized sigma24 family protein